jgi:aminocarboxymuconate-semialdehyde decarboxylase
MTALSGFLAQGARVDVHTHVIPRLPQAAEGFPVFRKGDDAGELSVDGRVVRTVPPGSWDLERRLLDMRDRGIDHHVLSPIPPLVVDGGSPVDAGAWADGVNESIAELLEPHAGRFSGLGLVAQGHPALLAGELQRAHQWGLSGVLIGTDLAGRELDDPVLDDFFGTAADLGLVVFVHPIATTLGDVTGDRITGEQIRFGLAMTTETAIAASKLVFGGVLERHPRLRVLLAHGGGTFFWALTRARRLMSAADLERVAMHLANVYVDSVVYDVDNLRYLLASLGRGKVLYGTDYPLPAEDRTLITQLSELDQADVDSVLGGASLRRLLGC